MKKNRPSSSHENRSEQVSSAPFEKSTILHNMLERSTVAHRLQFSRSLRDDILFASLRLALLARVIKEAKSFGSRFVYRQSSHFMCIKHENKNGKWPCDES